LDIAQFSVWENLLSSVIALFERRSTIIKPEQPHDEKPTNQEESPRTPPRLASSYVFHWWEGDLSPGTGRFYPPVPSKCQQRRYPTK
jgi:hypothetical protein